MTHVGIKRLGAGRAQEDGSQDQETREAVSQQVIKAVAWIEGQQHAWMAHDSTKPEQADRDEPEGHDRAEQLSDPLAALGLKREQADQHQRRQQHNIRRDLGAGIFRPSSALKTEIAGVIAPSP